MKPDWDEWYLAVRQNLPSEKLPLSNKDHSTLLRWFHDGLTIRAATINLKECWKTSTGNHPLIDFTVECINATKRT
jgi:hypothetical protein